MSVPFDSFDSEENRDRLAEAWLRARHTKDWYLGEASVDDWAEAYAAVDDPIPDAGEQTQ